LRRTMQDCRRRPAAPTRLSVHSPHDALPSAVWIWLPLVAIAILLAWPHSAHAEPQRTEIEEPGQVERRPVADESRESAPAAAATDSDAEKPTVLPEEEVELQPDEATSIMPDSEAVDESIEEGEDTQEGEATSVLPDSEAVDDTIDEDKGEDKEVETQEGEATTVLPDSEAVDPSLDDGQSDDADKTADSKRDKSPPPDARWSIRWQNAFIVERVDDPQYQFLFGGRIQNDWGVYAPDGDLEDSYAGDGTGTKFRRARLYFQGQFFQYGFFKAEYDFSDGAEGTKFADVYMGLNLPRLGLVRVGYFKEPFSLEFQNSSNFISFNERSSSLAFTPQRNAGFMINGNFLVRDSTYALAFMRRSDDLGEGFSDREDYHLTARLTGLPYFEEGGAHLLHIELGYSHQFTDRNVGTRYQQGAANDFAPELVDTDDLAVRNVDLFNLGIAIVENAFSAQGEVTLTVPHDGIDENPLFWGAYLELSWWVTGENRRYLRGRGVFSRVVPKRRFDPEKGQWGALELATRYSWLDLSDDGIRGGTLGEFSLAANWVIFSNLRMSNNYVLSHTADRTPTVDQIETDSGIAHSWVTRFEIDF
jgi:phosphate-selective porin OprO/OprP